MNIFKTRTNSLQNKVLSTITIFSLFCYIFFGLSFVIIDVQAETWAQTNSQNVQLNTQTNKNLTPIFKPLSNNQPGAGNTAPTTDYADWSDVTTSQSPVITPRGSAMLTQMGPPASAACGISVSSNQWNYCMLAPVNGLIGTPFQTTLNGQNVAGERVEINDMGLQNFFAQVYKMGIMAVIALAIVMISFGGIRMATLDSISEKSEGKQMINAAFAGLFLALFSYVLLYTINPALLSNGDGSNGGSSIFPTNAPKITPAPAIQTTNTNNPDWRQKAVEFEKK
jgi:hypothetical protein